MLLAQDEAQRYKTDQIQVGDRVLADPVGLGKLDTCTVIGTAELAGDYRPGYTHQYQIRCDHNARSSVATTETKWFFADGPWCLTHCDS